MSENIVDIYDISYEGAGVGRINGQIVFVPKTLKDEKVRVRVVKKLSSFLLAEVDEVLHKSDKRIEAKCPYFDKCGGCNFQHCQEDEERNIKLEIIKKELAKAGYFGEVSFEESDRRYAYRNKLKLEVSNGKLGFFKAKTREFFEIESCDIASKEINCAIPQVKTFLSQNNLPQLRSVYFKQVQNQLAICLLFPKGAENLVKNIKKLELFDSFSIFFAFGQVLESNYTKIFNVYGDSKLIQNVDNFEVPVDVSSFNQVNDNVAEKLYTYIEAFCVGKRVVNAYSGQGLLTFRLAKSAKFVYGIEYQVSSHESAERLCNLFVDYKIENICGKVEEVLSEVLLKDRIDCIVLDPAREGCQISVLEAIAKSCLKEVVYVSCNFSTLVRDLRYLTDYYDIFSIKIFNMFPCCVNMETVAYLKRKEAV